MKTIGLLGGMSWHSTALYYELLNQGVQQRLGGYHSARILMCSVDFAEVEQLQREGEWDKLGDMLADKAKTLQQAGADFLVIGTNTMHISVPIIEQRITIPVLHIADATADAILAQGFNSTGLLGTRFTMQMDYFKSRLQQKGLKVLVPDESDIERVDHVIFNELCFGNVRDESRQVYLEIMDNLEQQGAQCVIEGCTEISMLVQPSDTAILLFDTTSIHARAAVDFALS